MAFSTSTLRTTTRSAFSKKPQSARLNTTMCMMVMIGTRMPRNAELRLMSASTVNSTQFVNFAIRSMRGEHEARSLRFSERHPSRLVSERIQVAPPGQ